MGDRYRPRPRSPILGNPGRSSLQNFGYYESDRYAAAPSRREIIEPPRSPIITQTVYKVPKADGLARRSSVRDSSRTRRSTLDSTQRPMVVIQPEKPRHSHVHGGHGRPDSPMKDPYRSSDEGGDYYTVPASSSHSSRGHRRQAYSTTMDNADLNRLSRERQSGTDRMLRVGSGRDGTMYPGESRSRQAYQGALPRRKGSVDEYGGDGYGYTNPKELAQYDLNRTEPRSRSRRESYDGARPPRPTSTLGYPDAAPRSYDARGGPPPSTRGFDRIGTSRAPAYEAAPTVRMPLPPGSGDINSRDLYFDAEPPRRSDSRSGMRPAVYNDQDRRRSIRIDGGRDDDSRYRREAPQPTTRYDGPVESRGFGIRTDPREDSGFDKKRDENRRDHDRKGDYNDVEDRDRKMSRSTKYDDDDRDRKGGRPPKLDIDHDDRDRKGSRSEKLDDEERDKKSKGGKVAAGLSLAGAALGITNATRKSREDESESERDEPRRRRDVDEHKKSRDTQDEREQIVDLSGRDPRERHISRDDTTKSEEKQEMKEILKNDEPGLVDLSGRNPQEKRPVRDEISATAEQMPDRRERRRLQKKPPASISSDSSDVSPNDDGPRSHRSRRDRPHRENVPAFDPKNTMDLRALKDALNAKDSAPHAPTTILKDPLVPEPLRESSFERKKPDEAVAEDIGRRGRQADDEDDRRPPPRVVSPPRMDLVKKTEEKPAVKGILRAPRDKFPEDPVGIREGVAPLKGTGKDIPPDKRWTKIDRRLVNPDALEAGKERYETREDFVVVLRVLTKEEIQAYAIATEQLRALRRAKEEDEDEERRRKRRERHERHRNERHGRDGDKEHTHGHRHHHRDSRRDEKVSNSESDTTEDETFAPKMIESGTSRRKVGFDDPARAAGKGPVRDIGDVNVTTTRALLEGPMSELPSVGSGYTRNPPARKDRD